MRYLAVRPKTSVVIPCDAIVFGQTYMMSERGGRGKSITRRRKEAKQE